MESGNALEGERIVASSQTAEEYILMLTVSGGFVRRMILFVQLAIFASVSISQVRGQSTNSSLSGIVKDPSGAVIPKAHLTLTSSATGTERAFDAGSDGIYRFGNLQAGAYTLKAAAVGFADFVQQGIVLSLNQAATLNVQLVVGAATQTVEVTATASPLNYQDATHRGEITPTVLAELPLDVSGSSRSAVAFVTLLPGVNTGSGGNPFETRIKRRHEDGRRSGSGWRFHAGRFDEPERRGCPAQRLSNLARGHK